MFVKFYKVSPIFWLILLIAGQGFSAPLTEQGSRQKIQPAASSSDSGSITDSTKLPTGVSDTNSSMIDSVQLDTNGIEDSTQNEEDLSGDTSAAVVNTDSSTIDSSARIDTVIVRKEPKRDTLTRIGTAGWQTKRHTYHPPWLYPGVSVEQDELANKLVDRVNMFSWDDVDRVAEQMRDLERKNHLPPLSYLLTVSAKIQRLQNGEFPDKHTETKLLHDIRELADVGMSLSDPERSPDSIRATNMLIFGGIKGFTATLKLNKNPVEAAMDGFAALKILEKTVALNPRIKDTYLGLGIFYCALAKAPAIVKGTLNIVGKNFSLDTGLNYLRMSAAEGRYTSTAAKIYLIQFLSPYQGDLDIEKQKIFKSLLSQYPSNPYYLFLEFDENLCFHPERIFSLTVDRFKKIVRKFTSNEYSLKRYAVLVKMQYMILNPYPYPGLEPDISVNLKEYSFYPLFLQALQQKFVLNGIIANQPNEEKKRKDEYIRKIGDHALKLLDKSGMSAGHKGFYVWHIRDALKSN